ncbi:MAG: hypothetical protein K0R54_3459 [Clostridiaceae bacterium]|jgi:hypothetical protein|nr:hypothetical protein [Clostridiaceae bacterium]
MGNTIISNLRDPQFLSLDKDTRRNAYKYIRKKEVVKIGKYFESYIKKFQEE